MVDRKDIRSIKRFSTNPRGSPVEQLEEVDPRRIRLFQVHLEKRSLDGSSSCIALS